MKARSVKGSWMFWFEIGSGIGELSHSPHKSLSATLDMLLNRLYLTSFEDSLDSYPHAVLKLYNKFMFKLL